MTTSAQEAANDGFVYEPTITVQGLDDALIASTVSNNIVFVWGRTDNAVIDVHLYLPEDYDNYTKYERDDWNRWARDQLTTHRDAVLGLITDVRDDLR